MYSEDLHILQKSSVNLLRSIPRNLLRENQRSFCWIPLFLQNVKKRTQNYAYSVSSRIMTDANEIFLRERERVIGIIFFPYFFQLQSVYYANLRNQPFLLAPRRLRNVSQGETSFTSGETSQAARRGVRNGCFHRQYLPEGAD